MTTIVTAKLSRFHRLPNDIEANFRMPVPTDMHIHFTDELVKKAQTMKQLMVDHKLNEIRTISSTIKDTNHSYIELYVDTHLIQTSKYEDFDRLFDTFEKDKFNLIINCQHHNLFYITFLYYNGGSEVLFKSEKFML